MIEGACAESTRPGELLVVTIRGVLSTRAVRLAGLAIVELLADQDARAVVFSMKDAVPLFGRGWEDIAALPAGASIKPPVAIVVSPVYQTQLRAYCLAMARRGLLRGPFIGEPAALEWAASCREHWEHRSVAQAAAAVARSQSQRAAPTERMPYPESLD